MAMRDRGNPVLLRAKKVHVARGIHPAVHRAKKVVLGHLGYGIRTFEFRDLSNLKIEVLDVSYNDGSIFYPNLIDTLPLFKNLTLLKMKNTCFINAPSEAMVSAIAQSNITGLDLSGNFIGSSTVSLRGLKLRSLRLGNTMIGSDTPLHGILPPGLEFLDLSNNDFGSEKGEEKLKSLGEYLIQSTKLSSLNMRNNCLNAQRDEVMKFFIRSLEVLESNLDGPSNHDFRGNFSRTSPEVSAALESFHQRKAKRDDRWRTLSVMLWIREQEGNIWTNISLEIVKLIFHY